MPGSDRSGGIDISSNSCTRAHYATNCAHNVPLVRRTVLPVLSLLLALSTIVVAQGPRLLSREWYAQFSGAYSQPVAPFRIVGNIYYVGA